MSSQLLMILVPAGVVGAVGFVFGIILAFSAKAFYVPVDPRITQVRAVLPGVNCGACGQTGCEAFAKAVVDGSAKPDGCPVGGEEVAQEVAAIIGVELTSTLSYVARVHCGGNSRLSKPKYEYVGVKDCVAAGGIHGGPLACNWGCTGYGNCRKACPFDAIVIEDELARVVESKCRACEKCVTACPKRLITMVPRGSRHHVACKSIAKGAEVRKNCQVGCIACSKCVKVCPKSAITLEDNLARIDPKLCDNCGACVESCPTKAIRLVMA